MTQNTVRRESSEWQSIYREDVLVRRRFKTHERKLRKLGLFSEDKNQVILDSCCGAGEMLDLLASHGFSRLYGFDLLYDEKVSRELAKKKWNYAAASGTHLPFCSNAFDWILCAHSLHHLWPLGNVQMFVDDAYRCLKPNGRLALIDHYDSFQLRAALAVLLSPAALITPWTRMFREQHLEEKEVLFDYLRHWRSVPELVAQAQWGPLLYQRDLFFFYFVLQKK